MTRRWCWRRAAQTFPPRTAAPGTSSPRPCRPVTTELNTIRVATFTSDPPPGPRNLEHDQSAATHGPRRTPTARPVHWTCLPAPEIARLQGYRGFSQSSCPVEMSELPILASDPGDVTSNCKIPGRGRHQHNDLCLEACHAGKDAVKGV